MGRDVIRSHTKSWCRCPGLHFRTQRPNTASIEHKFFLGQCIDTPCPPLQLSLPATSEPSFIYCDERCFSIISRSTKSFLPVLQAPFQGLFRARTKNNKNTYEDQVSRFFAILVHPCLRQMCLGSSTVLVRVTRSDSGSFFHQDVVCWMVFSCVC